METTEVAATPLPPLTPEERHDLRQRVLAGYKMTVEEARRVYETLRVQQGAAAITGEEAKPKRSKKREAMSDQQLEESLKNFGL